MRKFRGGAIVAASLALAGLAATAQEAAPSSEIEALKKQVEALTQRVQDLEREVAEQKRLEQTVAVAPVPTEEEEQAPIAAAGPGGFWIQSPDEAFRMRISGFIAHDFAEFDQDDELYYAVGDEQGGTGFRYARLRLNGSIYENIDYSFEMDFAGQSGEDTPSFKDVYLEYDGIPYLGDQELALRAGHFREPFSMEELMSSRQIFFMERSLMNAFAPSRNPGIQISDALLGPPGSERMTYALGLFKPADDWPSSNDSDEDQGWIATGRITGLPLYLNEGEQLLHLGFSYSHRNPDGAVLGWSARPEARLSQFRYVNAEGFELFRLQDARADDVDLYGFELAGAYGPLLFQSEYTLANVDTTFDHDRSFDGYYAQLSYVLTGERRPYRTASGYFGGVKPAKNFGFGEGHGWGAWEAAVRYSSIDLNDGGVRGGEENNWTLGLNWYLNPSTRLMWNYVRGDIKHDLYEGDLESLQMRFQIEF